MFKEDLRITIEDLLDSIKKFKESQISDIVDENLKKSFEKIKEEVSKGIDKISKDIKVLFEQAEWETFNIAFFGETNAGKSTLIEALIRGDGRSIGDGRKDFTKEVNKKSLGNITFLDMPGLEGKEGKVLDEIHRAVNKSHVVFYVIGTNKEPEEGTLRKVKNFLNKKAKVYSVINIRGKPNTYKYKTQLIDENTKKLEYRVKKKLQDIFNGHYYGNVNLNALMGFLAVYKPNRGLYIINSIFKPNMWYLRKEQKKVKKVFGSLEKAYQFSNLHEIEKIIEDLRQYALEEVKVSNTYKFLNSLASMQRNVLKSKEEFDKEIGKINNLAKNYQREIETIYLKYKNYIKYSCDSILNEMENEMRAVVYDGIESKWSERCIKQKLKEVQKSYKNKIQNKMKKILEDMKTEIESKIKEFEKRLDLYVRLGKFTGEINLKEIIEKLKIDFSYIFKQVLDVVFSIVGVITVWAIHPILGIITSVLAVVRKIWDWLFGDPKKRKREAKQKAYKKIKRSVKDMKNKINRELNSEFRKLKRKTQGPVKLLEKRAKDLKKISSRIDGVIQLIRRTQKNISTLLIKEIVDNNIEYAYIDLDLSSMLVIGIDKVSEDMFHLFRIKYIKSFSSLRECLHNVEHKIKKDVIYVKDEFLYWAFDAISLDSDEYSIYKFRKWR